MWDVVKFFSDRDDIRRLCLGGNIGGQALACGPQVVFADDVVAVKNRTGLVAGDAHGYFVTDASANEVPSDCPSQVVEIFAFQACQPAGFVPGAAPVAYSPAVGPVPVDNG